MPLDQPRLAIDYGAACTQAVLGWPDGRWEPLSFDGALVMPSAVHTGTPDNGRGGVLVGEAAWRQAAATVDGFVASPLAALDDGATVVDGGSDVAVEDLATAALRHAAVAAGRVGAPVADVRLVVPAGWGPRRRTWLRRIAHQAGLGQPRLVEAPIAAAARLLAVGAQMPVRAFLLICDLGAGREACVLRRGPTWFEVLFTPADSDAGGTAIDTRLTAAESDGPWWARMERLHPAREMPSQQTAVPMPMSSPPLALHSRLVDELAQPVLRRAADLAEQTVAGAEVSVEQQAGAHAPPPAGYGGAR